MSTTFRFKSSILVPGSLNLRDESEETHPFYYYSVALIRAGYVNAEVSVYTGVSMSEVEFMMITSDHYITMSYKIGTAFSSVIQLDNAQTWRGRGMLDSLGVTPPSSLFFSNASGVDANIKILLGVRVV